MKIPCNCGRKYKHSIKLDRELKAGERQEILKREAKRYRVGQRAEIAGENLIRVDGRKGKKHQRWNFETEQKKIEFQ